MPSSVDQRLREAAAQVGFEVDELAGAGASGSVYRARLNGSDRVVALKVLRPVADTSRFDREVATLGSLSGHDGIPALVDSGIIDGQPYVATEWVAGRSLADLLRDGALPPNRALDIFSQLASTLDTVHDAGVIHRDLSPANILIDDDGRVQLVDFGVSHQHDNVTMTAEGVAPGTPRYLAPEVLAGSNATPASDQYGAAIVLYEMLTGRFAYRASADTLATTLHDHVHGSVIAASEANPWLPTSLDAPLERALSKEPDHRFDSVSDFAAALRPTTATGQTRRPSRAGLASLAGLGVAALVVGAVGGWLLRGDERETVAEQTAPYLAPVADWRSGVAAGLDCNLAIDPGFDGDTMPASFYDADAVRNALVASGGVGQTAALAVGTTDDYGLYGEVIPVDPDTAYVFSLSIDPVGDIEGIQLRISWLDADFAAIGDDSAFDLDPGVAGRVTVETTASPASAAFAVPTIEKSRAPGSVVIDEMVFANAADACADQVRP